MRCVVSEADEIVEAQEVETGTMTGLQDERPPGDDPVYDILNRFIGVPEQTYDQFEASFTHRPAEKASHGKSSQGQYSLKMGVKEELHNMADSADVNTVVEDKSEAQIDNLVDPVGCDADTDCVEGLYRNLGLLPGEAEMTCYFPTSSKDTRLEFQVAPESHQIPTIHQTDEVQPFALEEGFDYDRVSLSPKFSEAEIKLLKTLRNQRIKNEDP